MKMATGGGYGDANQKIDYVFKVVLIRDSAGESHKFYLDLQGMSLAWI